ncbi:hypothetical protein AXF42_Ash015631 [Apostasia shenzhenica]|uniref:Uncharacterized protein n=1 Tax=Apostasia shenzhenica TaxID=1088818 RepID=A0A2I0AL10_9ASPA|nr:hypothetical protein AXF42_Ash015631 [Apostasia shenzhenica]
MNSEVNRVSLFSLLLLLILFRGEILREADARPVPVPVPIGFAKVLQTLGLMCRCCDGAGGECRSSRSSNCAKLDCRPWKFS